MNRLEKQRGQGSGVWGQGRTSLSTLHSPLSTRAAVTLLEVLISIFVLAVGLLSVAALLPVASFQAARAMTDQRTATLGEQIVRDFKARNLARTDYWYYQDGNPIAIPDAGGHQVFVTDTNSASPSGNAQSFQPLALDPLMLAYNQAGQPLNPSPNPTQADLFATDGSAAGSPGLKMKRIYWFPVPDYLEALNRSKAPLMTVPFALQTTASADDTIFTYPANDTNATASGQFNSAMGKRSFGDQFTWVATIMPMGLAPLLPTGPDADPNHSGGINPNPSGVNCNYYCNKNLAILSVVVFNQRNFNLSPAGSPPIAPERAAKVQFPGGGVAGGDLTLTALSTDPNGYGLTVKVGQWIMLGWMVQYQYPFNALAANQTTQVSPCFRWYRVVSAAPVAGGTRNITVSGPDINTGSSMVSGSAFAFIYDGAVGVYEKTIRLDGPSMWSY